MSLIASDGAVARERPGPRRIEVIAPAAVNADVHDIDVIFVDEQDDFVNPMGIKGLGEIGIVGVPAAIANAVYHATGVRVRDLPSTLDKLTRTA